MIDILNSTLPIGLDGYAVRAEKSFIDALTTLKGSVIGKPDYGTILPRLKHKSFDGSWIIDFKRCLKDACKHDPRLKFKGAKIDTQDIGIGKVYFDVQIDFYNIKGVANV